jgi:hypothetical protein
MDQRLTCGVLGKYLYHVIAHTNSLAIRPLSRITNRFLHSFCRCILIELITNNYLFAGANDEEQLDLIFRVFGTPSDESWPGVTQLPGWAGVEKKKKPKYPPQDLNDVFGLYDFIHYSDVILTIV